MGQSEALGIKYKGLSPPAWLEEEVFPRNLLRYGEKWGPTWDYMLKRYGPDWEAIIEASLRPGGADLGF